MVKNQDERTEETAEKEQLPLRLERFCLAFVHTGDKYKAFDIAGYEAKTQGAKASAVSRLLRKKKVKNRIAELNREYVFAEGVTTERIAGNLAEMAFDKENAKPDRNRSLDLLGKHTGFYLADNEQRRPVVAIVASTADRLAELDEEKRILQLQEEAELAIDGPVPDEFITKSKVVESKEVDSAVAGEVIKLELVDGSYI